MADRNGSIKDEPIGGGCAGQPIWGPYGSLRWCVGGAQGIGWAFLPAAGAVVRRISSSGVVLSKDGQRIAYLRRFDATGESPRGDLVVENLDGSGQHIVRTDVDDVPIAFSVGGEDLFVQHYDAGFTSKALPRRTTS